MWKERCWLSKEAIYYSLWSGEEDNDGPGSL